MKKLKDHIVSHPAVFGLGVVLIVMGVFFGSYLEDWSIVTSLYIIVQIITTIGYGDLTVTGQTTKLWMAFYATCVMVLGGFYLNLYTRTAREAANRRLTERLQGAGASVTNRRRAGDRSQSPDAEGAVTQEEPFWSQPKCMNVFWAGFWFVLSVTFGTVFFRIYEHCTCSYGRSSVYGCEEDDFETCRNTGGYVKTWNDTFYMSIITLLTIGFGDHTPRSWVGRLIGCFWMLFGVSSTANFVASISQYFFVGDEERDFALAVEDLLDRFKEVDEDGSGSVSHAEFLTFMLVKHQLVSEDVIEQLNSLFNEISGESGLNSVTIDQLEEVHDRQRAAALVQEPCVKSDYGAT